MKIKEIYEPVYRAAVGLLVCPASEFSKHTKKLNIEGIEAEKTFAGAIYPLVDGDGCKTWLVWFAKKPSLNYIVHETWHLVDHILASRGVDYDTKGSNEAFAYYQEFWFDKLRGITK